MEAGRALDELVANAVMGWSWEDESDWTHANALPRDVVPYYSSDIRAAWQVVERMRLSVLCLPGGEWWSGHFDEGMAGTYFDDLVGIVDGRLNDFAVADTAPLAICLAALKAVGAEVPA